jgi:hypothetical protein
VTADGVGEGKGDACTVLEAFVKKHLHEASEQLTKQLRLDRQWRDVRDRRSALSLPEVNLNGVAVQVESQIHYRAADGSRPERISDPEIRYSFKIPNTDLWKSGNITTGRGLAESVSRKIAELDDDARQRDRTAETKRRQVVELTGLQNRAFTHTDELAQQWRRLEEVKIELEKSSNASDTASDSETQAIEVLVAGNSA